MVKKGICASKQGEDKLLTTIVAFRWGKSSPVDQQNEPEKVNKDYPSYYWIEKNSRRVVAVSDSGSAFVFYLTKINQKWYFTIIDNV